RRRTVRLYGRAVEQFDRCGNRCRALRSGARARCIAEACGDGCRTRWPRKRQHLRRRAALAGGVSMFTRASGRAPDQMRDVRFSRRFARHAEGSVLVEFGDTQVLCTASVEDGVPSFLRGKGQGWVTAEYG